MPDPGLVPGRKDHHSKAATQTWIMTDTSKEGELEIDRMQLSDQALDVVTMRFRSLGESTRLAILRLLEGAKCRWGRLSNVCNIARRISANSSS